MDLHQLRYVLAIAEEGNFTRAAAKLYLSQPSLSVQVRKLEQELGTPLFVRLGRRVALTAAGDAFVEQARKALFEVEEARRRVDEVRGVRAGRVSVGVLPSVAATVLPSVLARFRRRHPRVEVNLVEENVSHDFEQQVHGGQLDLAVIRMPCTRDDLEREVVVREPMLVLLPPRHRLAGRSEVSLSELRDEQFVSMKPTHGLHELLVQVCARAGFTPRITVTTGQLSTVWGMVRAGAGVAALPRIATAPDVPRAAIADVTAVRELGVIWRSGEPLSPPADAFLRMLVAGTEPFNFAGAVADEPVQVAS